MSIKEINKLRTIRLKCMTSNPYQNNCVTQDKSKTIKYILNNTIHNDTGSCKQITEVN